MWPSNVKQQQTNPKQKQQFNSRIYKLDSICFPFFSQNAKLYHKITRMVWLLYQKYISTLFK